MSDKNSFIVGFALGCIVPVAGYVFVDFIFSIFTDMGWIDAVSPASAGRRFRTIALIAICSNLIPFNIAKNKRWDDTMRGIVFPTLIYVAAWIWKFYSELFA